MSKLSKESECEITKDPIVRCALREFSHNELKNMPRPMIASIYSLIKKAMDKRGPDITKAELEGIRELVTEHIYGDWWVKQYSEPSKVKGGEQ